MEKENSVQLDKGQSKRNLNKMSGLKASEVGECCNKTLGGMKWNTSTLWKKYIF